MNTTVSPAGIELSHLAFGKKGAFPLGLSADAGGVQS